MLHARTLTSDEIETLRTLVTSKNTSVRTLKRAYIIWRSTQGVRVPAIAYELEMNESTVRLWIKRFNRNGLPGLLDLPRPGATKRYTDDMIATILQIAAMLPTELGLPFRNWTLNRLLDYLRGQGISARRSQLHNLLRAHNVAWHRKIKQVAQASSDATLALTAGLLLLKVMGPVLGNVLT